MRSMYVKKHLDARVGSLGGLNPVCPIRHLGGKNLVDPAAIEIDNLELPILPAELLAHRGNPAQLRKHKAGKGGIFRIVDGEARHTKNALDLEDGHLPVHQPGTVVAPHRPWFDIGFLLWQIACDAGEDVGRRGYPLNRSVFVKYDRHVYERLLEHFKQLKTFVLSWT